MSERPRPTGEEVAKLTPGKRPVIEPSKTDPGYHQDQRGVVFPPSGVRDLFGYRSDQPAGLG